MDRLNKLNNDKMAANKMAVKSDKVDLLVDKSVNVFQQRQSSLALID